MNREAKKQATRDLLIQTALALYAEQGYEATTVTQITQTAGVAKGTFFNYFGSKEDLLLEIGAAQAEWVAERLALLAAEDGPIAPRLIQVMVELATRFRFTPPLVRAIIQAGMAANHLSKQVVHGAVLVEALVPLFERGLANGEFTSRYDAATMAALTTQTYFGTLFGWATRPGPAPLAEHMALSLEALFHGLIQSEKECGEPWK